MRKLGIISLIAAPFLVMAVTVQQQKPVVIIKKYEVSFSELEKQRWEMEQEAFEAQSELIVKKDYMVCDEVYFDLRGTKHFE